jgi:hypothetical protein
VSKTLLRLKKAMRLKNRAPGSLGEVFQPQFSRKRLGVLKSAEQPGKSLLLGINDL